MTMVMTVQFCMDELTLLLKEISDILAYFKEILKSGKHILVLLLLQSELLSSPQNI